MSIDAEKLYRTVGERLKRTRHQLEVTQSELAEAAGVLRTSVANLEAGRQRPPLHVLYRISTALGVEVTAILPTNEDVTESTETLVEVEGVTEPVPPRLAEFLRSMGGE